MPDWHTRAHGIRYCYGEQARGLHETHAEGRGVLLCVVAGGYPGPRRVGHLILKRKLISHGYIEDHFALLCTGTRRSPVEHAKPSVIRPRLVTTSNISLSWACSLALSGFEQLVRMELSRVEYFCSTSGIYIRKCCEREVGFESLLLAFPGGALCSCLFM